MSTNRDEDLVRGSGNVFRDFGIADADILQAKGILAARIIGILDDRRLSVRGAEKLTGFAAADFSRLRNADYKRFTLDRLIRMLGALDRCAEVRLDIRSRERASATSVSGGALI